MQTNYGSYIREQAIKNLLSTQEKIAETGNMKALIALSKFILKISYRFDNKVLQLSSEQGNAGTEHVINYKTSREHVSIGKAT